MDMLPLFVAQRTTTTPDPWHYNSAGYLDLGKRFAEAMSQFIK